MIHRRYIDAPWGQIHVADHGAGDPVLLLHQTPRSWDEFREVIDLLSNHFRLVAMDLPGMGASDPHPSGATIEGYAEAAAVTIRALDLGSAAVCGHHTGGAVALQLAASEPELVSQLILSSSPWIDQAAREARAQKTSIDTIERSRDGSHLLSLWEQRAPYYPAGFEHLDRFVADAMKTVDPSAGHHAVSNYRMEDAIGSVKCPVAIVEHSADPFASRHTDDLVRGFPDASVIRIDNGGVALEVTADEFSAALGQILAAD